MLAAGDRRPSVTATSCRIGTCRGAAGAAAACPPPDLGFEARRAWTPGPQVVTRDVFGALLAGQECRALSELVGHTPSRVHMRPTLTNALPYQGVAANPNDSSDEGEPRVDPISLTPLRLHRHRSHTARYLPVD